MRKTIEVADVLEQANFILNSGHLTQQEKRGVRTIIESILHKTGNYNGFSHNHMVQENEKWNVVKGTDESVTYHAGKLSNDVREFEKVRCEQGGLR